METSKLYLVCVILIALFHYTNAEGKEVINGTIYCNNEFSLYINGELIATDPVPTAPHNAYNVSFTVESHKDITFAIDGIDLASEEAGLELGDKCVGSGGLRAIFSNGVVTNNNWTCTTYHYGPVNWRECFAAQQVRNFSLQLLPGCAQNSTPPLVGCYARRSMKPENWEMPDFDDSRWEYALEWDDDVVGWGLPPTGCTNASTYISTDTDSQGVNLTCPQNLNWGTSKFIWRPDLTLDNHILCRFTLKQEDTQNGCSSLIVMLELMIVLAIATFSFHNIY